ncbi:Alpha/Beta hydrolase protein [Clohesyomyces aquaticus]|uniref:Alpha/Beta hydrolase protein n=1 Tax=Clohesyomyces aquaticus TaxID=1231657 RepID=A0A1Y1ZP98_9PLEO|nr:Alpha/Beta hydrolase protein [Clohesyomyces aquaticus]
MSISAVKIQDAKFTDLGLSKMIVNESQTCCYTRSLGTVSEKNPVLVLVHGYPQSAYMWRHLIPLLPSNAPLFIPDLPGYGSSAPIKQNDKLNAGNTLLSALRTQMKRYTSSSSSSDLPVVLIGHDRGARVAHRLSVSGADGIKILGICLIDIVPTLTQWSASGDSANAVGTFHWPLLANVELAFAMITAYGGDRWCTKMIERWSGTNSTGLQSLKSDDSIHVYGEFFKDPSVIRASNEDYKFGAFEDVEQQKEDQEAGRKIGVPVLLVYSEDYLGGRYDVTKEWSDWVKEGTKITSHGLGNGIGHFGVEEAPQETVNAILDWLKGLK